MGGIFGEGVDLVGDRLIGCAIVGVGLPQVNPRQEILRRYYDEAGGTGFDYAYRFPGMNKVLQAAGRVIRTQEDRGVVLLLDDRFAAPEYTRLFPPPLASAPIPAQHHRTGAAACRLLGTESIEKPVSAKTDRLFLMLRTFSGSYFFLGRDLRSSSQAVISTNVVARRAANASSRYCISLTARMA